MGAQLHSNCTVFPSPDGRRGPRAPERSGGSSAGDEGRLFQKAATRPSPCALKKRAAYAPRCAQPSPGGRGKVALRLHCFWLSESNIPHAAYDGPCHPGSAAGAIRDGTESQAEARTARRDDPGQRVCRPVAPLSFAAVRAACYREGSVPALRFASAGMTRRSRRQQLHSDCTVFRVRSLTQPPNPPSSRKACSSGVVSRPSSGFR